MKYLYILIVLALLVGVVYYLNLDDSTMSAELPNLIRLTSPLPNEAIKSPLKITGEARGYWFFEATFPVVLTDWDGKIIAQHYAEAQLDPNDENSTWMTEDFVPFEAILEFEQPIYGERGSLILQKDNPSGLTEHDNALEISIRFK
ncbi:MAG: Gmad2 immunoglobulin-like domain-containing protein [bacterium]|nr:Gmad2 immunoglobulin-like domain-containing protein [bacterium]